jgi:hypothetical protein
VAYHGRRTVATLGGLVALRLVVRRCETPGCAGYHRAYRPEAEGRLALPQGEFGLDVIAEVGRLRFAECRSVPEIRRTLAARGVAAAERTVTNLLARYEDLVALSLDAAPARAATLQAQGAVVLARSLLGAPAPELAALLREVVAALPAGVAVRGVVSDGQHSIRRAVRAALPGVPHQLCHFHYLREAARPVFEADRHAKKELKKRVRGVRPLERALEGQAGPEADALRGYCLAVRSALTDDGRPPLAAPGLVLRARLAAVRDSLGRAAHAARERGGPRPSSSPDCTPC